MSDRTKPPPGWRCYRADDGVYQCHPSTLAGWPEDVTTLCGKSPEPLIERAWAAMDKVAEALGLVEPRPLAVNAKEWSPRPMRFGYDESEVVPGYGMSVWEDGGRSGCHAEVVMDDRRNENELPSYAIFVDCPDEASARQVIEDHRHRAARPLIAAELRKVVAEVDYLSADDTARILARADELDPPG